MSEVQALVECPVIVGTAGHVDHGKSALIEALTGKNPDRLEVERRRGMTVELGFGELALPSGKIVQSFVANAERRGQRPTWGDQVYVWWEDDSGVVLRS